MDVTKLNSRQNKILEYLAKGKQKSRREISEDIFDKKVSKITLIRDINHLISLDFVFSKGSGRYIVYGITDKYALLYPIDITKYYEKSADSRVLKNESFNFKIFSSMQDIFGVEEKKLFENGKQKLVRSFSKLDETILKKELERFVIELSWKSSQIEGNTYSLLETEDLINNMREAAGHDKSEAIMILNHKYTFDIILKYKEEYKTLSPHDLRTLHTALIKNLGISSGVRKHKVGITGTKYVPLDNQHQIKEALDKMFKLLDKIEYVPEKALTLLALISYIQPFADGNKRVARMISNAVLLANNYFPLSYRSVEEVDFKRALLLFYEQNNLYHLKRIFIEQQQFAINNYFG